jgi:hypothetical protein
MNIDIADASESLGMAARVRTYCSFGTFVKYSISAIVLLPIGMPFS